MTLSIPEELGFELVIWVNQMLPPVWINIQQTILIIYGKKKRDKAEFILYMC